MKPEKTAASRIANERRGILCQMEGVWKSLAALQRLRGIIRAAAPKAEEVISYRIPTFRQHGMPVGFGATRHHCSFYLLSHSTVADHKEELAGTTPAPARSGFSQTRRCRRHWCESL
jgi:hypothetical protein